MLGVDRGRAVVSLVVSVGQQEVEAVGTTVHLLVDPREVDLEALGRVAYGAEHAEAAGVGDGSDHVTAVTEGEDRELDAEHVRDACLACQSPVQR